MDISHREAALPGRDGTPTALVAALIVGLVLRLWWAAILPYNGGPDEAHHYPMVQFLRQHGRLPTMADVPGGVPISYPALPPAGYAPAVLASLLVDADDPRAYWYARLGNVVVGVLLIWAAHRATLTFSPGQRRLAAAVAWLTALHPQFVFLSSYVNNDAAAVLVASLVWQQWIKLIRTGPSTVGGTILGLTAAAALLCKLNTLGVVLAGLALPLGAAIRCIARRPRHDDAPPASLLLLNGSFVRWYRCSAAAFVSGLLAVAPWCAWSLSQHRSLWGTEVHYHWWRRHVESLAQPAPLLDRHNAGQFLVDTWKSFWGAFGYCTVWLEPVDYFAVTAAIGIAAGAFAVRQRSELREDPDDSIGAGRPVPGVAPLFVHGSGSSPAAWILGAGIAATFAIHVYHSAAHGLAPQGRYLLPAAWPVLFVLAIGWDSIGRATGWRRLGPLAPVLLMAWLQWSAIGAERTSLEVEQPNREVRGRLLAYGALLPVVRGDCPDSLEAVGATEIVRSGRACQIPSGAAVAWDAKLPTGSTASLVFELYQSPCAGATGELIVEGADSGKTRRSFRLAPIEPSGIVQYSVDMRKTSVKPGASVRFTLRPALGTAPAWLYRIELRAAQESR